MPAASLRRLPWEPPVSGGRNPVRRHDRIWGASGLQASCRQGGIVAGQRIALAKGRGLPPGAAASGHINAMAMYAGESASAITAIEPVAQVIQSWCAATRAPARLM